MPTIRGDEIRQLIDLFKQRGVKIYHACQLKDFETYLHLGGIPSRNLMQTERLPYTAFETDEIDQQNEVWDNVFGNLSDLGYGFANGNWSDNTAPTPNPYGPILFEMRPDVLIEASDIAICLRSAGGRAFVRERESLGMHEVDRIFKYSIDGAPDIYARAYIKYSNELKKEFNDKNAMTPEISCTVINQKLPLDYTDKIIVDHYIIEAKQLVNAVREMARNKIIKPVYERRPYKGERKIIKNEIINLLESEVPILNNMISNHSLSHSTRDWASRMIKGGIEWQYKRYAMYLREGTLLHILKK